MLGVVVCVTCVLLNERQCLCLQIEGTVRKSHCFWPVIWYSVVKCPERKVFGGTKESIDDNFLIDLKSRLLIFIYFDLIHLALHDLYARKSRRNVEEALRHTYIGLHKWQSCEIPISIGTWWVERILVLSSHRWRDGVNLKFSISDGSVYALKSRSRVPLGAW